MPRHGDGVLRIQATKLQPRGQDEHVRREAVAALVGREPELVLAGRSRRARGTPRCREARSIRRGSRGRRREPVTRARPLPPRRGPFRRDPRDGRARSGEPPPPSPLRGRRRRRCCAPPLPGRRMKSNRDRGVRASQSLHGFVCGRGQRARGRHVTAPRSGHFDEQELLGGRRGRRERLVRRSREIGAPLAHGAHVDADAVSMMQIRSPWPTCSPGCTRSPAIDTCAVSHDLVLHLHGFDHADQLSGRDLVTVGDCDLEDRPLHGTGDRTAGIAAQPLASLPVPARGLGPCGLRRM